MFLYFKITKSYQNVVRLSFLVVNITNIYNDFGYGAKTPKREALFTKSDLALISILFNFL